VQKESTDESEEELELSDDEMKDILDCIEVTGRIVTQLKLKSEIYISLRSPSRYLVIEVFGTTSPLRRGQLVSRTKDCDPTSLRAS
jgi:hypothetical protein